MTRLVWTLPDGMSTARWAEDEGGGGGSQPLVDLGVIEVGSLLDGPVTIYTPSAGEFVQITFGDVVEGDTAQGLEVGLASPIVTNGFAYQFLQWLQFSNDNTVQFAPPGSNVTGGRGINGTVVDGSQPIQALVEISCNAFPILTPPGTWQSNHVYPASLVIVKANGNYFSQTAGGTSGGSAPDFAGTPDVCDTVADNTVTWTNEGPIPTSGSIHLYALVAGGA